MKAILSVSDKTGIVDFARSLVALGCELYATGGTLNALSEAGLPTRQVSDLIGFPEILGGRVKTLHPGVHAGILARRDVPEHMRELDEHGLAAIDVVVVNLYPFVQQALAHANDVDAALEQVDIGGSTLLRAAAKNFKSVLVVVDPGDYRWVAEQLADGGVTMAARQALAAKAFAHTSAYDSYVSSYLRPEADLLPDQFTLPLEKIMDVRYGENPHQRAAYYAVGPRGAPLPGVAGGKQLHGKALSFNNLLDLDAAWGAVQDFSSAAVAIVKHTTPCGLACGEELLDVYRRALYCDPVSAFGGAVALNREMDEATAREIKETFFEDIVAPGYSDAALAVLKKKRDLRIIQVDPGSPTPPALIPGSRLDFKRISGGFLVQEPDQVKPEQMHPRVVSKREPTLRELTDLLFAWRAVKHVKSNGIVLAKNLATVGIGSGQTSRVDSVRIAIHKAGDRAAGSVLASDAFFPFPDGVEAAGEAGVTAIIQPGGSIRDDLAIEAANKHGMVMVFTDIRHFKH